MPLWAALFFGPLPRVWRLSRRNLDRLDGPRGPAASAWRSFRLFVNYAQAVTDASRCHLGDELRVNVVYRGRERLEAALARGKGAVVATGHLGAWQLGPHLLVRGGFGPVTVAMAEEPNPALQRLLESIDHPFRIVYTTRGSFATLDLLKDLRRGGVVAMQLDRPLRGSGISVPFCGAPARFSPGPAALARAAGAPLIPAFVLMRAGATIEVEVDQPIAVAETLDRDADCAEATRAAALAFEREARRNPLQWFNFDDFWEDA
jgi:lauroyl/myristoyl acyltransferase